MTLRNKLIVSTVVEVMLVILASVFLISTSRQIKHVTDNAARSNDIVETISEIRFVTFENLLHHDKRSFEQWRLKHAHLTELLQPVPSQSAEERAILDRMMRDSNKVVPIFNRLVASYSELPDVNSNSVQKESQERLATQLLVKQQVEITEAIKLNTLSRNEANNLRQQANRLVVAVIVLMFLISAVDFFFVTRNITKVLTVLQKGAQEIASGKYSYRIKPKGRNNELGQLAKAFNSMARNLEHTDKIKSDFILLASHQLRTPLTAIKWTTEELMSVKNYLTAGRRKKYIRQVHQSNERMIELVTALLEVSKIDFGTIVVEPIPVRLDEALEQVLKDLSAQIHDQKVTVRKTIDKDLRILIIDPNWVRIIFQNLISNAIKYSEAGQQVSVSIEQQKKAVLLKVADEGCGIPATQQEEVFDKLFRADNAQRHASDGSGLGLYMTKAIITQAGGDIWFHSTENRGTTFFVKLPYKESS